MHTCEAQISEIIHNARSEVQIWVTCPPPSAPAPGRYMMAWASEDGDEPLAVPLFPAAYSQTGFLATPLDGKFVHTWQPGMKLALRGPLGHGFEVPGSTRRLALAALDATPARLLPLIPTALERGCAVALFSDLSIHDLPLEVEINPLSALPEALGWADFLALDLPLEALPRLERRLGGSQALSRARPLGQALITTALPCGGLAQCGACSISLPHGIKLACVDGPVFRLDALLERF